MAIDKTRRVYSAALIGCGSIGSYVMDELVDSRGGIMLPYGHSEVLKNHPQTELTAGVDPDRDRLEDFGRRWEVSHLYPDHREMLERESPEIVSIASPPTLHPVQVVDCAEHGVKGIFCEKPVAPTLREADEMIRACDANGTKLSINHTRRGDPYCHQVRRLVEEGELGEILTVTSTWAGRLFLSGTHSYDLTNYFLGDIPTAWLIGHLEELTSQMTAVPTQRGVDVGGVAYVVYQNGIRAFLNGRDGHTGLAFEISGTKGITRYGYEESQLWKRNESSSFRELLKYPFPKKMRYTAPMVYLLEDLIEAMETEREPISSGRIARRALEQILATHYSSQHENSKVSFPFEEREMSAPFQWFGKEGRALYQKPSPLAQD